MGQVKNLAWSVWLLSAVACNAKGSAGNVLPPAASAAPVAVTASAAPASPGTTTAAASAAAPSAATAGDAQKSLTFAVLGVAANDVLNVREKPDAASKKVYSYAPTVTGIRATGQQLEKGGTPWVEVAFEGGTGWVNRLFLTEAPPGGGCNDPALTAVIRDFMRAVAAKDGTAVKSASSPLRGLTIIAEGAPVKIPYAKLDTLFSAPTAFTWGTADGSGAPVVGTFKAIVETPLSKSILGKGAKETCGKLVTGGSAATPPTLDEYPGVTPVSFYFPGDDGGGGWVTWVASLEYVGGKPYISALHQYHWEI